MFHGCADALKLRLKSDVRWIEAASARSNRHAAITQAGEILDRRCLIMKQQAAGVESRRHYVTRSLAANTSEGMASANTPNPASGPAPRNA